MKKLWANSGDSHFLEPEDLWRSSMPSRLAERMPRSESDGFWENVHVDGQVIRRRMPSIVREGEHKGMDINDLSWRPPGSRDAKLRLKDLDQEGIWAEIVYPSLGMWASMIKDPELLREGTKVMNDWAASEILEVSQRLVPTAQLPFRSVPDAIVELQRAVGMGFKAIGLPTSPPDDVDDWNYVSWEPLWAAADEAGVVLAFHIGSDAVDLTKVKSITTAIFSGPGGAVLNYVETSYSGQRAAAKLVASGALDRHPNLRILISEGGATWVPFLGDRMNEAYRQHGMFVRPTLSKLPKEILYRQVYASFQHDESAVAASTAMGYRNVMFGSDYPHLEGTFGHTQETLHQLFDGVSPEVRHRITVGAFMDLFPHVGDPPVT